MSEPRTIEQRLKPKKGVEVSMAFHYAGLVSWEKWEIDRVSKDGKRLWIDGQLYERQRDGTFLYSDNTLGPCSKVLYIDGGKKWEREHVR